jgi:sterol desaturase/sphingolipid hydroxylase (fatty acid hydroxylase superfamily)
MTGGLHLGEIHEMFPMYWKGIRSRYPQGLIEATISNIVLTIGFIFPATFYLLLDQCFPEFARRYKIQDWDKQPNGEKALHIVLHSLFNYMSTVLGIFLFHWSFGWRTSVYRMDEELPSICTLGLECFYAVVIREITFYYVHRLLHPHSFSGYIRSIMKPQRLLDSLPYIVIQLK